MMAQTKPAAPRRLQHPIYRFFRAAAIVAAAIAIAIQFIPYGRDHANPPVRSEPTWDSQQTRALFVRACADCHSNETVWPWYSSVAPMSWLVTRDVQEGREKWNISEGDDSDEGDEAAEAVQEGSMPPFQYVIAHRLADLSLAERQALIRGLIATFDDRHGGDSERDDERDRDD